MKDLIRKMEDFIMINNAKESVIKFCTGYEEGNYYSYGNYDKPSCEPTITFVGLVEKTENDIKLEITRIEIQEKRNQEEKLKIEKEKLRKTLHKRAKEKLDVQNKEKQERELFESLKKKFEGK